MEIIKQAINKLIEAKNIEEVYQILDELKINDKYRFKIEKYPALNFSLKKEDIQSLKSQKIITTDNHIGDVSETDSLAKLLYAVLWKQGDLKKVNHIIEGILTEHKDTKKNALVFYQFGKHLANQTDEPIIDQHVLRAFSVYEGTKETRAVSRDLVEKYKEWLRTGLSEELRKEPNYDYHVDKVLFALGKYIKDKSRK